MPNFARHSYGSEQLLSAWKYNQQKKGIEENKIREQMMMSAQAGTLMQDLTSDKSYLEFAKKNPAFVNTARAVEMQAKKKAQTDELTLKEQKFTKLFEVASKHGENLPDSGKKLFSQVDQLGQEVYGLNFGFSSSVDIKTTKKEKALEAAYQAASLIEQLTPESKDLSVTGDKINRLLGFAESNSADSELVKLTREQFKAKQANIIAEKNKANEQMRGLETSRQELIDKTPVTVRKIEDGSERQVPQAFAKKLVESQKGKFEIVSYGEKEKSLDAANKYPLMSEAMASGWYPSRRMSGQEMDVLEAALVQRKAEGKPVDAEFLKNSEFDILKNVATGRTAGNRLVVARKQNIATAFELLDDMEKTNKNLDYSNVKFQGKLDKFVKGELNDPDFVEYMTQRADALFVLGNALKQNGLTDKSIEVEEEAATPTLAPRAFGAWLNVQRRALNRSAKELNDDYKYKIDTVPTAEPGTGGAGPKTDNQESSGPKIGTVEDGYKFKGGDPSDPKNWEKM